MKPLSILWQRLVTEGKTCDRCNATYQEMQRAMEKLKQSLQPLGIEPRLVIREIRAALVASAQLLSVNRETQG